MKFRELKREDLPENIRDREELKDCMKISLNYFPFIKFHSRLKYESSIPGENRRHW